MKYDTKIRVAIATQREMPLDGDCGGEGTRRPTNAEQECDQLAKQIEPKVYAYGFLKR